MAEKSVPVRVPRLNLSLPITTIDGGIREAVGRLGYSRATDEQASAIREFVLGKDVFVTSPTGSGKSLCYAALPYVFDFLRAQASSRPSRSIVVVVCPLQSIMEDQVRKYQARGLQAALVGKAQKDEAVREAITNGKYQLVYMSPEAMLLNLRWREMFRSDVYQSNLMGLAVDEAHCVEMWGVKFRKEFSNIAEIRSLLPHGTNIVALTATARVKTRENIMKSLEMTKAYVISKVPNNSNVFLAVLPKPAVYSAAVIVDPVVQCITKGGISADRHLVFCRTYPETVELFQEAALLLDDRNALYTSATSSQSLPRSYQRTCEKYDACTAVSIKKHIVESFTDPQGTVRAVFSTIAFAMGLDSPNIRHMMHWGPPTDIETYVQEVGRSGRNGQPATAILLYQPTDFRGKPGVSDAMKEYCTNTTRCRREELMKYFDVAGGVVYPARKCLCCDVCAKTCSCQSCHLPDSYTYYKEHAHKTVDELQHHIPHTSTLSSEQCAIKAQLLEYRRQLCERVSVPSATLMVGIEIASGIPDKVIDRVVTDYALIQDADDLIKLGVTSREHAAIFYDIIMSHHQ